MPLLYSICALIAFGASPAAAQTAPDTRGYVVFLRGTPIGREDITVRTEGGATVVSGTGRLSPPLDIMTRRAELRYDASGPTSMTLEGTVRLREMNLRVDFAGGQAKVAGVEAGEPKVDTVSPGSIVVSHTFFGFYEALAQRLTTVTPPAEVPVYLAPHGEVRAKVTSVANERVQTGGRTFDVRRYELSYPSSPDLQVVLTADALGRLIRLTIPSLNLDVVRDDVASSTSRTQTYANPKDEPVTIPGSGFNIAGTLTKPAAVAARHPAVILVGDSGVGDRDGVVAGIPTLGQLAGALADAGYIAVRYDKRGYGQTGGRAESATLADFAEDARAVVRYLEKRKDVDPKRIVVLGHGEGAWVALQAAAREKRIAGVVSIAAPATTGNELLLEQQQLALDEMKLPDAERQAKVELQKRIHAAAIAGKGWEDVPAELRRSADTPLFQSILTFDPAKVVGDVKQPILIVHGELDRQVPVAHAERLAALARKGDSRSVEIVTVRGVNHLLVPATTGSVREYASLPDRTVSGDVTKTIVGWLAKTFAGKS